MSENYECWHNNLQNTAYRKEDEGMSRHVLIPKLSKTKFWTLFGDNKRQFYGDKSSVKTFPGFIFQTFKMQDMYEQHNCQLRQILSKEIPFRQHNCQIAKILFRQNNNQKLSSFSRQCPNTQNNCCNKGQSLTTLAVKLTSEQSNCQNKWTAIVRKSVETALDNLFVFP